MLADGRVWPASRAWVAEDFDLAVLRVQVPRNTEPAPLPPISSYLDFELEAPPLPENPSAGAQLAMKDGKAYGLIGQRKLDGNVRVAVSFRLLPEGQRPLR